MLINHPPSRYASEQRRTWVDLFCIYGAILFSFSLTLCYCVPHICLVVLRVSCHYLLKLKHKATGRGLCDSDLRTRLLFLPSGLQPCGTAERLTEPASPLASPAWPDPPALAPTGPRRRCRRLGCQRDRALSRWRREMVMQQQQFKDKFYLFVFAVTW